jgi:aryl-alcohol dehydrogenase-like predicted oxidoreductase
MMQYRTHKGERISEIGIGGYALSGVYGKKDPEQFVQVVQRAYDLGVNFFDVADIYGSAEEVLGRAVAPFRRQVWIATKVGWGSEGKPDCSPEHVASSCEQSLKRLQTDVIDLYQMHFDDPQTPVEATVEALETLKAAGKIRHYGAGHLPPDRLAAFFTSGKPFSELTELSAVARTARQRVLPLCQAHHVAAIAFSVTGRGLLTGQIQPGHTFEEGDIRSMDPLFQRERFASGLRVAEKLRAIGEKYGKTSAQVAIAWTLAQPGVVCALTGPSTIPHLEENLAASGWTMTPQELDALDTFFREENERLQQEQRQSIQAILSQDVSTENTFTGLVYALETLVENGWASEEAIIPYFHKLLGFREQPDVEILNQVKAALRAIIFHNEEGGEFHASRHAG